MAIIGEKFANFEVHSAISIFKNIIFPVFFDGMEHIEDQAMNTDWLPEILPKGVRLIISSNPNR